MWDTFKQKKLYFSTLSVKILETIFFIFNVNILKFRVYICNTSNEKNIAKLNVKN